jgi:hypothetical protein
MRYVVTISEPEKGLLMQRVDLEAPHEDVRQTILQQVLDTKEAQVRAALIRLGWTPPDVNKAGYLDIPDRDDPLERPHRVTVADVQHMEKQLRLIADALHL